MRQSSVLLGSTLLAILVAPAPDPAIAQCTKPGPAKLVADDASSARVRIR